MKEYALTVNLKDDPEIIAQYKQYHGNVWPEVRRSLEAVGVREMKIFLLGRRLFMYLTADDYFDLNLDLPKYLTLNPKCQEWEDLMTQLQEPVPEAKDGEKWALMEKVFDL